MNNHGLDWARELAEQQETDYVFGAASKECRASVPFGFRETFLPIGETQRGAEDTQDCASRSVVNILETKFNYMLRAGYLSDTEKTWLIDNGYITDSGIQFSDAFIAILSGTTRNGNSLKAPCDAAHRHGLIPKSFMPLEKDMTWDEYHDPKRIKDKYRTLGQEFLKRFPIFYERVMLDDMISALTRDMLDVGAYAWPTPDEEGVYQPVDYAPNHAFVVFDIPQYQAFDNYPESKGDYIKRLAPDYNFIDYAYRVYIGYPKMEAENELQSLVDKWINALLTLWRRLIRFTA